LYRNQTLLCIYSGKRHNNNGVAYLIDYGQLDGENCLTVSYAIWT